MVKSKLLLGVASRETITHNSFALSLERASIESINCPFSH